MEPKDAPVLAGARVWTPPAQVQARLLEEHRAMAARERPAEPVVVTAFPLFPARGEGCVTYAVSPDPSGGAKVRQLRLQYGHPTSAGPLEACVAWLWSVLPEEYLCDADGNPQRCAGCLVYRPDTDVLRVLVHPGESSSQLATRGAARYAADIASAFFHQAAVNGQPLWPVEDVWWGPYVGSWRLAGVQVEEPRREGDGDRFDRYVRLWLSSQYESAPGDWVPVEGTALRITSEGALAERVIVEAEVPWWDLLGRKGSRPTPMDAELNMGESVRFRTATNVDALGQPSLERGMHARVAERWCREADGSLVRMLVAFDPTTRTLERAWYRYERADELDPSVFDQPIAPVALPEPVRLPGVWELRAVCSEPELVQYRDPAYNLRPGHWTRVLPTEIPAHGWQTASGLRMTIADDGSLTEECFDPQRMDWWSEESQRCDRAEPFDAQVVADRGTLYVEVRGNADGNHVRWTDIHGVAELLFPQFDGSLIRVQSASFEDHYMFHRVHLRYERMD